MAWLNSNLGEGTSKAFLRACMAMCCPEDEEPNYSALDIAIDDLLGVDRYDTSLRELIANAACVTVALLVEGHPDADERLNYLFFHYQGLTDGTP